MPLVDTVLGTLGALQALVSKIQVSLMNLATAVDALGPKLLKYKNTTTSLTDVTVNEVTLLFTTAVVNETRLVYDTTTGYFTNGSSDYTLRCMVTVYIQWPTTTTTDAAVRFLHISCTNTTTTGAYTTRVPVYGKAVAFVTLDTLTAPLSLLPGESFHVSAYAVGAYTAGVIPALSITVLTWERYTG